MNCTVGVPVETICFSTKTSVDKRAINGLDETLTR